MRSGEKVSRLNDEPVRFLAISIEKGSVFYLFGQNGSGSGVFGQEKPAQFLLRSTVEAPQQAED